MWYTMVFCYQEVERIVATLHFIVTVDSDVTIDGVKNNKNG